MFFFCSKWDFSGSWSGLVDSRLYRSHLAGSAARNVSVSTKTSHINLTDVGIDELIGDQLVILSIRVEYGASIVNKMNRLSSINRYWFARNICPNNKINKLAWITVFSLAYWRSNTVPCCSELKNEARQLSAGFVQLSRVGRKSLLVTSLTSDVDRHRWHATRCAR